MSFYLSGILTASHIIKKKKKALQAWFSPIDDAVFRKTQNAATSSSFDNNQEVSIEIQNLDCLLIAPIWQLSLKK